MEKGKKVFLRFSSLGDVIFANYSAMRIKEKHTEFHLTRLTDSMYAGIVRAQPWVDEVMEWDRRSTGNSGYIEILKKARHELRHSRRSAHAGQERSFLSLVRQRREIRRA